MTERELARIAEAVRRKPAKHDAARIGLAVGAVIDKRKMRKHFTLDIADGRFAFQRREEEIAAEARLDSIYVIRTSLPKDKIGAEAAVAAYKKHQTAQRMVQARPIGRAGDSSPWASSAW